MRDYIKAADAHIEAKLNNNIFTNPPIKNTDELLEALLNGETFEWLLYEVVKQQVSTTSRILSEFGMPSEAYKRGVRKGFKNLFASLKKSSLQT